MIWWRRKVYGGGGTRGRENGCQDVMYGRIIKKRKKESKRGREVGSSVITVIKVVILIKKINRNSLGNLSWVLKYAVCLLDLALIFIYFYSQFVFYL